MRERTITDPTFTIYKDGGNVENKSKAAGKEELLKLAKDEADLIFDLESGISDRIIRDFNKEKKPGQSITDWLDTKPREYFLNIPLELKDGGNVILLSDYLKQKRLVHHSQQFFQGLANLSYQNLPNAMILLSMIYLIRKTV